MKSRVLREAVELLYDSRKRILNPRQAIEMAIERIQFVRNKLPPEDWEEAEEAC